MKDLLVQIDKLLNKVNKVTAYHRHGNKVPLDALDELANRQLEFEMFLKVYKKEKL